MPARARLSWAALGFGLAALASSWNPLAAPFGFVVGLAAAFIAVRALATGQRRAVARIGFAAALAAILASGTVLALTAGVGRGPGGPPIVPVPDAAEVRGKLDAAAEQSRAARERADAELKRLEQPKR